jgi:hypothetical protein
MKLWNWVKAVTLWAVLTFLSPAISYAQLDTKNKSDQIMSNNWDKSDNTIYLKDALYLNWKIAEIKEWEIVYVLYPTNSKDEWLLLLGIPYNKKEMKYFQTINVCINWKITKIVLATQWAEVPWTDFFRKVKIK